MTSECTCYLLVCSGYVVAQLVEALCFKLEGRSRVRFLIVSLEWALGLTQPLIEIGEIANDKVTTSCADFLVI
jgi:hypothetical protein